jgi:hypothetical protein
MPTIHFAKLTFELMTAETDWRHVRVLINVSDSPLVVQANTSRISVEYNANTILETGTCQYQGLTLDTHLGRKQPHFWH